MSLLAKMGRRRPAALALAGEALALLVLFRICLVVVPVRRIIGTITRGKVDAQPDTTVAIDQSAMTVARRVQWAVRAAARHFPVEFVCFPQTLAAYWMLHRRGLASTIVYGVSRSPRGELLAHTWLEMGDRIVVGGEESEGFAPIERWK
jgi:Transglutaminase-like superfamily